MACKHYSAASKGIQGYAITICQRKVQLKIKIEALLTCGKQKRACEGVKLYQFHLF